MVRKPTTEPTEPTLDYHSPEWLAEREEQLDDAMRGMDVTKLPTLTMRWNGIYKFRIMPVLNMLYWLTPYGEHWNLFPTGDPKKPASKDGCPRVTYGLPCAPCEAIDKALAEKRAKWDDFGGKGGIVVQKKFLLLVLLLEVDLIAKKGQEKPPVFKDLPDLKILECPTSVAKTLRARVADPDYGWEALTHPYEGAVVKVDKDDDREGAKIYDTIVLPQTTRIPDEYLEFKETKTGLSLVTPDFWPKLEDFLPKTTPEDLIAKIEKFQNDVNPFIVNYVLGIEHGEGRVLPRGGSEESKGKEVARPSGPKSMEEIRAKLKGGK
jgi:hypothetical protein